jgi:hypothetical protein
MGKAGRARFVAQFAIDAVAREIERLYAQVLAGSAQS